MTLAEKEIPSSVKDSLTRSGGCYYASNFMGWHIATSPWEAMAGLDLVYSGNNPSIKSEKFLKVTKSIYLWYIPDWKAWDHIDNYAPVKEDGTRAGILIYGNRENDTWVTNFLNEETVAIKPTKY
jgi:hypothetical protein